MRLNVPCTPGWLSWNHPSYSLIMPDMMLAVSSAGVVTCNMIYRKKEIYFLKLLRALLQLYLRTNIKRFIILHQCSKIWNSLPQNLTPSKLLDSFLALKFPRNLIILPKHQTKLVYLYNALYLVHLLNCLMLISSVVSIRSPRHF